MQVTDLYIYPVKSLQGIRLNQSNLLTTGLPYDRQWMLVDSKGTFVTQRQLPLLATISTKITEYHLILSHANAGSLSISLTEIPTQELTVKVWQSTLVALDEGSHASEWLQQVIGNFRGSALRLVRFDNQQTRPIKEKYLKSGEGSKTHFADGFPYLITSEQTLTAVNKALSKEGFAEIGMERFRANIVVDTLDKPFDDLFNRDLEQANGEYQLSIRKPCERCPVTTVDQKSGVREAPAQPLAVLRGLNPMEDRKGAYFGGNAILTRGEGATISVGDRLKGNSC